MPYIVIVADEMADLMMTAAKEVEATSASPRRVVRGLSRAGHQKPTVDVITGLIKSACRQICFEVSSRTDSRVVLDEMGPEKLLGHGDMLLESRHQHLDSWANIPVGRRDQQVIAAVATAEPQFVHELVQLKTSEEKEAGLDGGKLKNRDELYEAAVDVVRVGRGSVSLLQRAFGYGQAARLIDYMAKTALSASTAVHKPGDPDFAGRLGANAERGQF